MSHYPLLLFGGASLRIDHTADKISIVECDGEAWLSFRSATPVRNPWRRKRTPITCRHDSTVFADREWQKSSLGNSDRFHPYVCTGRRRRSGCYSSYFGKSWIGY